MLNATSLLGDPMKAKEIKLFFLDFDISLWISATTD